MPTGSEGIVGWGSVSAKEQWPMLACLSGRKLPLNPYNSILPYVSIAPVLELRVSGSGKCVRVCALQENFWDS